MVFFINRLNMPFLLLQARLWFFPLSPWPWWLGEIQASCVLALYDVGEKASTTSYQVCCPEINLAGHPRKQFSQTLVRCHCPSLEILYFEPLWYTEQVLCLGSKQCWPPFYPFQQKPDFFLTDIVDFGILKILLASQRESSPDFTLGD